jgi:tRNA (cytidine/uridine-2'-O-)-methyltransferase
VFHVALYQPEIPPNTGNIIRLCANTGAQLHLIHPLGFAPHDKKLERAGLDYHAWTQIRHHENFPAFMQYMGTKRIFACSTKGVRHYNDVAFEDGDVFLFGPETSGLPEELLASWVPEQIIRLPMVPQSRSLNLSNAVAVVVYEAWRQWDFKLITV